MTYLLLNRVVLAATLGVNSRADSDKQADVQERRMALNRPIGSKTQQQLGSATDWRNEEAYNHPLILSAQALGQATSILPVVSTLTVGLGEGVCDQLHEPSDPTHHSHYTFGSSASA